MRPRIEINWKLFDKYCRCQCTLEEIASFFDCSADTIERAVKRDKKTTFAEYRDKKAEAGCASLRRKQFAMALKGDRVMLIWLGKQYLGQREKTDIEGSVFETLTVVKPIAREVIEVTGQKKLEGK